MSYAIYVVSFVICLTAFLLDYKIGIAITISACVSVLPVLLYSIYEDLKNEQ